MRRTNDETLGRWVNRLAPVLLPLVLFFLLRPDWYYELNRIDTFFYAGYAQNLGYLLDVSGQTHYFVTRWPLYLPERFFFLLFGAKAGFLVFRWMMSSVVAATLMWLGRQRLRWQDNLALTTLLLIMPMYLRTVLNGYGDSLAVTLGFIAIAAVALRPGSRLTTLVVGVSGGLIFTINPLYSALILVLVAVWLFHTHGWRERVEIALTFGVTAIAVCAAGFLLFRFYFDIPNVYSPMFHALDRFKSLQDNQKSSQLWWMGYRIWIYLPAAVLLAWRAATTWFGVSFERWERLVLQVCAVQYAFQIWYQFSRHGDTVEISYYWSPMVPAFVLALAIVVTKFCTAQRAARHGDSQLPLTLPLLAGGVLLFILAFRTNMPQVYSHWTDAVIVIGVIVYLWRRGQRRWHAFALCSLMLVVFTFQFGAPRGEPWPPGEKAITRVDALYNTVYDDRSSFGVDAYKAVTWFRRELHRLGTDVEYQAYFWTGADGISDLMAAMYQVQITGRWLDPKENNKTTWVGYTDEARKQFVASGQARVIVLAGTAEEVATFQAAVDMLRPGGVTLFEGVSPNRLAVHVRVLRLS